MENTLYDFSANRLNGESLGFEEYKGKVVLVVNTASKCGFTPQLEGLESLYRNYKDQGLVILGFPCNQFGNQEPGDSKDIQQGCLLNYGVTFPMFEKIEVNGEGAHPLYKWLTSNLKGLGSSNVKWNFTKFLVDRQGNPVKRFSSAKKPEALEKHIQRLL